MIQKKILTLIFVFLCLAMLTMLLASNSDARVRESFRQHFEPDRNLLANPGFENYSASWTKHASDTFAVESTTPLDGKRHILYTSSSTGRCMASEVITVQLGMRGHDCEGSIKVINDLNSTGDLTLDVYDGSNPIVSVPIQSTSASISQWVRTPVFSCPGSGTMQLRLCSANGSLSTVKADSAWLGDTRRDMQVSQAEVIGTLKYDGATNCVWFTTSGTWVDFGQDTDCNVATVTGRAQVPATKLPRIVFPSLGPGKYTVVAQGQMLPHYSGSATTCRFSLAADTGTPSVRAGAIQLYSSSATTEDRAEQLVGTWIYPNAVGETSFSIQSYRAAGGGECQIPITDSNIDLTFTVTKFPLESQTAYDLNEQGFFISAKNSVGAFSIGTGNDGSWQEMDNSGISLVLNPGSGPAMQTCTSTEVASGLTCSGNENIGISFDISKPRSIIACVDLSHLFSAVQVTQQFKIIETANNSQTQVVDTEEALFAWNATGTHTMTPGHSFCRTFNFTSVGQKTLRLVEYTSGVSSLTLNRCPETNAVNWVITDAVEGHQIVINNTVSSPVLSGRQICSFKINNSAGTPVEFLDDGCIASITDIGVGDYELYFETNFWPTKPSCTVTMQSTVHDGSCHIEDTVSDSKMDVVCHTLSATPSDRAFYGICIGPR